MSKVKESYEIWEIDRILAHPDNAKKHSAEQIKTLAGLVKKYGWTSPIIVQKDTGFIIAGHGRRLTAIKLGMARVPVIVKDVTDEEAAALRLADNRVVSTDYDTDLLQSEMARMAEMGFDMLDLGFSDKETEFMTMDLAEIDTSMFVDDIGAAVEEQKAENIGKLADIDDSKTPLGAAFGFGKISVLQSRRIKNFMVQIEGETKLKGPDALMTFFDSLGVA